MTEWLVEPLGADHVRDGFACGDAALDHYLLALAGQDVRRGVAGVYVMRQADSPEVMGYYTLSAYALERGELPEDAVRRLPPHPRLPALLLGRLAVDQRLHGAGLGGWLLADALGRCLGVCERIGAVFVVVHAAGDAVVPFYQRHGFEPLLDHPLHLFLPLAIVRKLGLP
ncbi:MAG: GNAT family N-acetyltransferase [Armatimonadetes bacterium]|nr:GNAT family N-acetyltransferase [Armatimonadota bacterium]